MALEVAKPHPLSQLVVVVMGLVVVTPEFFKFGSPRRPSLKYNRAMKAEKYFWFSDAAKMRHPDAVHTITRCMELAQSRWRLQSRELLVGHSADVGAAPLFRRASKTV